ncbi:MAG: SufD family Fe-S cluster assembly protein [Candidatus Omnitrophica bacterium]|nr:SufD family Fe-S cluster assembly protein [Candidatus Omnitrophota bacterium]
MSKEDLNKHISESDREKISSSGMDFSEKTRSGSFLQEDAKVLFSRALSESMDILSLEDARRTFPRFADYWGKAFQRAGKEFPPDTEGGYFIRVKKGQTVELPIQACLFLKAQKFRQKVHNIIIVEEDAKVYLITGCSASKASKESFHLGLSEFFVEKGGYLNFTMIHSWREDVSVKPMSVAVVEEGGSFVSNYVCLRPVKEIVMYPTALLEGEGARASFNSLILSHPGTLQDIGSRVILNAKNTQAEIVSRAVSTGGKTVARGHLQANAGEVKAHLECRGLMLSPRGVIQAIPELETSYRDVDMSHEAAIGKISKDEIEYLCARGLSEDEAQSIIIRGFMDVNILALPPAVKSEVAQLEEKTLYEGF